MENRGIIKALVLLVVGLCVLFLIISLGASYVAPLTTPGATQSTDRPRSYSSPSYESTNSMLDFLDTGAYGGGDRVVPAEGENLSKHAGKVTLSSGSASYATQPYEEYVEIRNDGEPVNITGWKLENGKGGRPIEYSYNSYVYPSPDSSYIGNGTEFLDPSGKYLTGPIVLKKGDRAIVTTSSSFSYFPLPITTNFRENMCLGYLDNYPFYPQVEKSCPLPASDPQIRTVTDQCYDYVRYLSRCENPEEDDKTRFDEMTSHCKAFIRARLNYPSCVANNRYSTSFSSPQWRIFLGRAHEMWAANRELIKLYDATGLLVDQISY